MPPTRLHGAIMQNTTRLIPLHIFVTLCINHYAQMSVL